MPIFLSVPSVLSKNFLRTLSRDSFAIGFGLLSSFDCILLCLSLVSLVSLVKISSRKKFETFPMLHMYVIWVVYG
jgi:hypothetical protein